MPERFIHSRSLVMPSFVTLLFVQCHHVLGQALAGGFLNPSLSESRLWAKALALNRSVSNTLILKKHAGRQIVFMCKLSALKWGMTVKVRKKGVISSRYPLHSSN